MTSPLVVQFPKKEQPKYTVHDLQVSDAFMQKVIGELDPNGSGEPVARFVKIKSEMRRANNKTLSDLRLKTADKFLWSQPFMRQPYSQAEANFADVRNYTYKGKKIDQQVHLGYDLAVTQHIGVEASNDGKVVYAAPLGIYGNCTVVDIVMANVLNIDKQIAAIGALAEGSSIRSIERMTGVHRDTIMRLGVRVGRGCTRLMDAKMRDLPYNRLEMDEIWGFVGKKDRNVRLNEPRPVGNVWTFCAIDAGTKLVPAFKVGDRDTATAKAFVRDVASRMRNRVQISTDGLRAYVEAIESAFGAEVDFAQIVKSYGHEEVSDNRRYSAPEFVSSEKKVIIGNPDVRLISTSYVERLNATTRLHMRRLTRLTLAFSKKRENFEAAVGLHFAYYNFVKRHNTLRCTPAMAAGVERDFWSGGQLLEAAA